MRAVARLASHPAISNTLAMLTRPAVVASCAALAWIATAALLLLRDDGLTTGFILAIPLAVAAVLLAICAAIFRAGTDGRSAAPRMSAAMLIPALALIVQIGLLFVVGWRSSQWTRARAAEANLQAIWRGLAGYQVEHKSVPPTLAAFASTGRAPTEAFVSPADPRKGDTGSGTPTSFEYLPPRVDLAGDPAIILLFEREAWTPLSVSILPPARGRYVLFYDGSVRPLDEAAFGQARAANDRMRHELGWDAPAKRK